MLRKMESGRQLEYHSLCFESHGAILIESLTQFFIKKAYVNVTLVCKGEEIVAHQTILAAYSPIFDKLLREKSERHPIIIFNDVTKEEMMVVLEFMYKGIVNVPKTTLPSLLRIAKLFQIRSLEDEISKINCTPATPSRFKGPIVENSGVQQQFLARFLETPALKGTNTEISKKDGTPDTSSKLKELSIENSAVQQQFLGTPALKRTNTEISKKNGTPATSSKLKELPIENSGVQQQFLGTPVLKRTNTEISKKNDTPATSSKLKGSSTSTGPSIENSALERTNTKAVSPVNQTTVPPRKKSRREPSSKIIKINPWATNRRIFEDNDSTFCEDNLARPGPSNLGVLSSPTRNSDSDIEIINTNSVVVISETQPDGNCSPEWFRKTQPKSKKKVTGSNSNTSGNLLKKTNRRVFRDSEEDTQENETRVNFSNLSAVTALNRMSIAYRLLKKKKYIGCYSAEENRELLKLSDHELRNYCFLCRHFKKDMKTHIKRNHNVPPRRKVTCKVCSRSYFREAFLKFHKCVPL